MSHPEWDGQQLLGDRLGLAHLSHDAGTAIPARSLVLACSEEHGCLIRAEQIGDFLRVHRRAVVACHDVGSLHWSIADSLAAAGDHEALDILWDYSRSMRFADIGLLSQLVALAQSGIETTYPPLSRLASEHGVGEIAGEKNIQSLLANACEAMCESIPGALIEIGVEQAVATLNIYRVLIDRAGQLADDRVPEDAIALFGPLSLGVQVKGAIALARASHLGLRFRRDAGDAVQAILGRCDEAYVARSGQLRRDPRARNCFYWDGDLVARDNRGRPRVKPDKLAGWLDGLLGSSPGVHDILLEPPRSAIDRISTVSNAWGDLVDCDPLLRAWSDLESAAHVRLAIVEQHPGGWLKPSYATLPRITSRNPNLEQARRFDPSALFEPPPGTMLLVAELPDLELRCVAEVYPRPGRGESLTKLFIAGGDPVSCAAERLYRRSDKNPDGPIEPIGEDDRARFEGCKVIARAILHGIPRGLSPRQVRQTLSPDVAKFLYASDVERVYKTITDDLFPELGILIADFPNLVLIEKFGCEEEELFFLFDREFPMQTGRILRGLLSGKHRRPDLWEQLRDACQEPEVEKLMASGRGSALLYDTLLSIDAVAGSGRVRGHVPYYLEGTLNVLDLADDVRKVAIYAIVEAGYELVGVAGNQFVLLAREGVSSNSIDCETKRVREKIESAIAPLLTQVPLACRVRSCVAW